MKIRWVVGAFIFTLLQMCSTTVLTLDLNGAFNKKNSKNHKQSLIFGEDDRIEALEVKDFLFQNFARSTVAIFNESDIRIEGDTAYLKLKNYGKSLNMDPKERFYNQKLGAICSGALAARQDQIITAGHCVRTLQECKGKKFVFDFFQINNRTPSWVPASNVFGCQDLIISKSPPTFLGVSLGVPKEDYAVIRLTQSVKDRRALAINTSGTLPVKGTRLFMIGHPMGLSTKFTAEGKVVDYRGGASFYHYARYFPRQLGQPCF